MTQSTDTSTDNILEAARCTVAFCLLYSLTFVNVLINKKRSYDAAKVAFDKDKDKKKEYDRYTSPSMRTADRLQANFLEWCPIYFGLMWSLAMTNNLSWVDVVCCRLYIAFRALYIVLILKKGVGKNGFNQGLYLSTFPAYGCLNYMCVSCIKAFFL